ncbi:MAG: NAD(P)-dependent alcohol dehydrogenase [Oscillospiraceae bacterium]|nr:NAD(P)-dependent alcohol dehydrogenase [Oscillospiraceae bacterium]
MQGKMKVAIMEGIGKIKYEQWDIPQIKPGEALIKLDHVGVCGSDLHYFDHGRIGDFIVEPPFVLGHEAAGTVIEVSQDVSHLKPGDKVALEPGKTCGECEFCKSGRYNLCPDVVFFATPPVDGVFCEYVAHEAALCFKLPDNMTTVEGALIEPLAVGFHAANQGGAHIGQTAVVFGAGCIGLVSMLALHAEGVSKVYVVDVVQKRLEKALQLGAAGIINPKDEDPVIAIRKLTGAHGCDLAIDTAGADVTIEQGINLVKKGGTIVFVGYSSGETVNMPMNVAINKELTFKTIFRYRHIYPMAIEAVSSGRVKLADLVTNYFDFDDLQNALEQSIKDKENIVKSVIAM